MDSIKSIENFDIEQIKIDKLKIFLRNFQKFEVCNIFFISFQYNEPS